MNDGVNVMVEICEGKIEKKDVNTTYVDKSRRYKSMRVFYVKNVEDSIVPKEAFRLGTENGWTMWKWLEN
jgi:hypothetical protein